MPKSMLKLGQRNVFSPVGIAMNYFVAPAGKGMSTLCSEVISEFQDDFGTAEAVLYYLYGYGEKQFRPQALLALRSRLENGWSFRTSYCDDFHENLPKSYGQCYVTARTLNLLFDWIILCNRKNGNNHYWNKLPTGQEIDFTSDQKGGDGILPTAEFKGTGRIREFKPLQECKSINPRLKIFLEALLPLEERFVNVFNPDLKCDNQTLFEKHPNLRILSEAEIKQSREQRHAMRYLVTYSL